MSGPDEPCVEKRVRALLESLRTSPLQPATPLVRVNLKLGFSIWLGSGYADVFIPLSAVIVPNPNYRGE